MKNILIICLLLVAVSNAKNKFKDHSETREIQKEDYQVEMQERQEAEETDDPFIDNYGNGTTFNEPENLN